MPKDTWLTRDLPVLRAIVELYDSNDGQPLYPDDVARAVGFEETTVETALRALDSPPSYFEELDSDLNGNILMIGRPTAQARRVTGAWPSPESLLERLISALTEAANDDEREPEERSKLTQVATWLGGAASQVAISALGGAGAHLIS